MTETAKTEQKPNGIFAALAAAQAAMGRAVRDANNPHFRSKYADLASVQDACMTALNKQGIAVYQPTVREGDEWAVKTVLAHESGETLECSVPLILGKHDMQGLGSAVTYARRYGLMCMAGVAPEDDDGNAAAAQAPKNGDAKPAQDMSQGLRQAWSDGIKDSLPEGASQHDLDRAYANAICAQFHKVKSLRGLHSNWDKRQDIIAEIRERHPEIAADIDDAYASCERALNETKEEEPA